MKQHESACVSLWQLVGPSSGHDDARLKGGCSVGVVAIRDWELGLATLALKISIGFAMERPVRL